MVASSAEVAAMLASAVDDEFKRILIGGLRGAEEAQRRAQEHASTCTEIPCERCGRRACEECGKPSPKRRCAACSAEAEARRLRGPGLASIPERFAWASFGSPLLAERCGQQHANRARHACTAPRVTLIGTSGAGKSSLAAAMLRHVLEQVTVQNPEGASSRWVSSFQLARARSGHPLGQGEPPLVAAARAAHVLVIDELGSEVDPTGTVPELLYARHDLDAATWVTTWLSPIEIANRYGGGVGRRLFEAGISIDFTTTGAP